MFALLHYVSARLEATARLETVSLLKYNFVLFIIIKYHCKSRQGLIMKFS